MATSGKTKNSKPTSSSSERRLAPRRGTTTPSRRSEASGSHRLVRRVQAILPRAKRNSKPSPAESLATALERAAGGATARAPLSKRRLGIVGGETGDVTVAKRRRNLGPNEPPATSPTQATNPGAGDTHRPSRPSPTLGNHRRRSWRSPKTRFFSCCMIVVITTRQIRLTSNSPTKSTPNSTATY